MFSVHRNPHNPIITSDNSHPWRQKATFNPSPACKDGLNHLLYRAETDTMLYRGERLGVSTIGHTIALDPDYARLSKQQQLIVPEEEWEMFGCEDPRVTLVDDTYYIFYTALGLFPFRADGIRVAVATTKDLQTIESKHLVTPFNAKAMALFPEKVGDKWTALLTVNSDQPPAKMAFVQVDTLEELWDQDMWVEWYTHLDDHTIDLRRRETDHVEVGAVPIKTDQGWLLVYSHIQNYFQLGSQIFGIEAVLLDLDDPRKVLGQTRYPFMVPEESYEQYGQLANIIFPSGALLEDDNLRIFYGACDTASCSATVSLSSLLTALTTDQTAFTVRSPKNPLLEPIKNHPWESQYVLNPTAVEIDDMVHILYRAVGADMTSVVGCALSRDGTSIDERLPEPIYIPRADFEQKLGEPGGNSGCEDARAVLIRDRLHITYTAYNGRDVPAVAESSITLTDFQGRRWDRWSQPQLISPPGIDDKDAAIFPEKIHGQYMVLHRVDHHVCADFVPTLDFASHPLTRCIQMLGPRNGMWDSQKVGIAGPPFKTSKGWVLFYHGITEETHYCLGAALLDSDDPTVVLARSALPIMEPSEPYEREGWIANVVFPCGQVLRDDTVYLYYGAADTSVCLATIPLERLLASLA